MKQFGKQPASLLAALHMADDLGNDVTIDVVAFLLTTVATLLGLFAAADIASATVRVVLIVTWFPLSSIAFLLTRRVGHALPIGRRRQHALAAHGASTSTAVPTLQASQDR
jgi:hypothetical protein